MGRGPQHLFKSCAVGLGGFAVWEVGAPCQQPAPCLQPAQNLHFRCNCRQNRRFWAPGRPDGLPTGLLAPKTASRRASWRPRQPPDGLLAPKTASWRPRRPSDRPPGTQDGLPTGLLAPKAASARASWRLHDNCLDETSVRSTELQINFAAGPLAVVALCDGYTLVLQDCEVTIYDQSCV